MLTISCDYPICRQSVEDIVSVMKHWKYLEHVNASMNPQYPRFGNFAFCSDKCRDAFRVLWNIRDEDDEESV